MISTEHLKGYRDGGDSQYEEEGFLVFSGLVGRHVFRYSGTLAAKGGERHGGRCSFVEVSLEIFCPIEDVHGSRFVEGLSFMQLLAPRPYLIVMPSNQPVWDRKHPHRKVSVTYRFVGRWRISPLELGRELRGVIRIIDCRLKEELDSHLVGS